MTQDDRACYVCSGQPVVGQNNDGYLCAAHMTDGAEAFRTSNPVTRWKCVGYCRHCTANEDDSTFSREWGHFERSDDGAWVRADSALAEIAQLQRDLREQCLKGMPTEREAALSDEVQRLRRDLTSSHAAYNSMLDKAAALERSTHETSAPFIPCPLCNGVEGCDHSVPERERAAFERWLMKAHGLSDTWDAERRCYGQFAAHLAYKAWCARGTHKTGAKHGE